MPKIPNSKCFRVGQSVRALNKVTFMDGAQHKKNQIVKIGLNDLAYYIVCAKDYEVVI